MHNQGRQIQSQAEQATEQSEDDSNNIEDFANKSDAETHQTKPEEMGEKTDAMASEYTVQEGGDGSSELKVKLKLKPKEGSQTKSEAVQKLSHLKGVMVTKKGTNSGPGSLDGKSTCKTCGETFHSVTSLRYHELGHTGDWFNKLTCDIHKMAFANQEFYENHVKAEHPEKPAGHSKSHAVPDSAPAPMKGMQQKEKLFKCDKCDKRFSHSAGLKYHMHFAHRFDSVKADSQDLSEDQPLKTRGEISQRSEKLRCQYCDKSFRSQLWLRTHEKTHTDTSNKVVESKKIEGETTLLDKQHPSSDFVFNSDF